jgi:hypothetical protein
VGLVLVLALAGGCGEAEPPPELPETRELTLDELGRLGGEIYNEPERVEAILEAAGLTPEEFEKRVRKITNDPVLSREYSRGFEAVARPLPQSATPSSPAPPPGAGDSVQPEDPGASGESPPPPS